MLFKTPIKNNSNSKLNSIINKITPKIENNLKSKSSSKMKYLTTQFENFNLNEITKKWEFSPKIYKIYDEDLFPTRKLDKEIKKY